MMEPTEAIKTIKIKKEITEELNLARLKLNTVLADKAPAYFTHMKQWFQMKISKEMFDTEARKMLNPEQVHYHNEFLLALLNKVDGLARTPVCLAHQRAFSYGKNRKPRVATATTSTAARDFDFEDMPRFDPMDMIEYLPPNSPQGAGCDGVKYAAQVVTENAGPSQSNMHVLDSHLPNGLHVLPVTVSPPLVPLSPHPSALWPTVIVCPVGQLSPNEPESRLDNFDTKLLAIEKEKLSNLQEKNAPLNRVADALVEIGLEIKEEVFLPDQALIIGRFMLAAWDHDLEGVEDDAANIMVVATQLLLKNILHAVIAQHKAYKQKNGMMYNFGGPAPNLFLRNTSRLVNPWQREPMPVGGLCFVGARRPATIDEMEHAEALEMACSVPKEAECMKLTIEDLYLALQANRNIIGNHSSLFRQYGANGQHAQPP